MEVGVGSSGARRCPRAFRHDDCKSSLEWRTGRGEAWWEVLVVVKLGGETEVSVSLSIILAHGLWGSRIRLAGDHRVFHVKVEADIDTCEIL